jgi:DNA-binding SARP family transcriptional activator/tetratricopeptide (TPR) repeat protein
VDFRLLGPTEVVIADDDRVEVGSIRERAILTMLLLRANKVVQVGQLIDAVWDDSPPATARSQVQQCISALRRKLAQAGGHDLLKTDSAGYVIRIPRDSIDVARFEELVLRSRIAAAEDRVADAVADLRAALALWHGPACAGVDSRVIRAAATRLDEDRLAAMETCFDLELRLGHHRELSGELGGLVAQNPLRERLRALYMLALYRSGHKAAALDAFRSARTTLVAELGLEPGDELSALHRGILAADPALDYGPDSAPGTTRPALGTIPVPRQLPSAIADFTGRGQEISELTRLLSAPDEAVLAGRYLPIAVLRGKGGVGKTALALHAAHALRQHYPDGHLYAQLRDGEGQPASAADVLAWFLRALSLPSAAMPDGLAERTATYRSLLGDRRVLIMLDDAHGTSQVLPLIPGNPGCGVIITSRNSLADLHGSHYFDIGDLDEAASVGLLGSVIGKDRVAAEPSAATALVRLCGCLPLALRIVAAKLLARPHWKLDGMVRRLTDEERRLDELALGDAGIRATVAVSYESLDQDARQLFRLLGLLGIADFGAWAAAPLLGCDATLAVELLDTLVDARLVDVHLNGAGTARFRLHELVRVYARERLAAEEPAPQRAAALERLLGCWLALAAEAHRRTYGGDFAILHGTATRFVLPDDLVDELLASPLGWLRVEQAGLVSAVHQAAQAGLDELCWELAMTLVTLFESDYQADNWRRTHEVALAATRRAANQHGEAAMLYSLGHLEMAEQPARATRYLEPALATFEAIGSGHGTALALAGLAFLDRLRGHYDQSLARYLAALGHFREAGDQVGEVDCLTNMAQIHADQGEPDAARGLLGQAVTACETLAAPRVVAQTEYRMGAFLLRTGDLARAERHLRLSLQMVRDEGDVIGEVYALHTLATVHTQQHRHAIAEAEFCAALDLSRQVGEKLVHGRVLLAYAEALDARHELDRAGVMADAALAVFSEVGGAPVLRARAHALQGRLSGRG